MQFSVMRTELSDRTLVYDSSIAADTTKLNRWLNMAQQDVCMEANWPFMYVFDIIQTTTQITTGTVSINAAATALTFSSAPAASMTGRFIQFSRADDWYEITAHTAGATTATIDPAYLGTTNLSGGTYIVRRVFYTVASTIETIVGVAKHEDPNNLVSVTKKQFSMLLPLYGGTGAPLFYTEAPPASDGAPRIALYPSPDAAINLFIVGIQRLTDMSADTDVSLVPPRFHSVILDRAEYYAWKSVDDNRVGDAESSYNKGIAKMKSVYEQDKGLHRVMQSIEERGEGALRFTMPVTFGPMS